MLCFSDIMTSQQPLKTNNAAPQKQKSQEQMQLLQKFKKLRQWQQQQQESMLQQQQQQMETVKIGQSRLQGILAAQRLLYEQSAGDQAGISLSPQMHSLRPESLDICTDQKSVVERGFTDITRSGLMTAQHVVVTSNKGQSLGAQKIPNSLRGNGPNFGVNIGAQGTPNPLQQPHHFGIITMPSMDQMLPDEPPSSITDQTNAPQGQLLMGRTLSVLDDTTCTYPFPWSSFNFKPPLGAIPLSSNTVLPYSSALPRQVFPLHVMGPAEGSSDVEIPGVMVRTNDYFPNQRNKTMHPTCTVHVIRFE